MIVKVLVLCSESYAVHGPHLFMGSRLPGPKDGVIRSPRCLSSSEHPGLGLPAVSSRVQKRLSHIQMLKLYPILRHRYAVEHESRKECPRHASAGSALVMKEDKMGICPEIQRSKRVRCMNFR